MNPSSKITTHQISISCNKIYRVVYVLLNFSTHFCNQRSVKSDLIVMSAGYEAFINKMYFQDRLCYYRGPVFAFHKYRGQLCAQQSYCTEFSFILHIYMVSKKNAERGILFNNGIWNVSFFQLKAVEVFVTQPYSLTR